VIVALPIDGTGEAAVCASSWAIKQVLACGVHGLLLCHAEDPGAARAFIEATRYPFNTLGVGQGLGDGRRGSGGQEHAAVWGITPREYLELAEPWPLNPRGELLLGLKIENKRALARVEESLAVPGLAFAEWGPGDMGMSLGFPDNHDEPFPPEMEATRARILVACKANGLAFLNTVYERDVIARLTEGVLIGAGLEGERAAAIRRQHTGHQCPGKCDPAAADHVGSAATVRGVPTLATAGVAGYTRAFRGCAGCDNRVSIMADVGVRHMHLNCPDFSRTESLALFVAEVPSHFDRSGT
jgi:4-hydroxy-2-oxoheptanedioate aldolase